MMSEAIATQKWVMVPMEKVLRHRKEFIQIDELTRYKRCRVQVDAKGIVLRDIVNGSEIKTKKQQVCNSGEFLVAEIDAKMGGFGIVPDGLDGAIVSSHYFLYEIDKESLEQKFLDFYIRTPAFRDQVAAQGSTNYAAIRPHHVLEYQIPLPSLEEQRRIVGRIEELVAKVEEAQKWRSQAQTRLDSFISSLHLHFAASRVQRLDEILELDEDRQEVLFGEEYPQVGVKGFGGGLFAKETIDSTQTTYKAFNRLFEGAIVLSQVKGWEGAIAGCPKNLAGRFVSPEYRTFRCIPDQANPAYMANLVVSPWFWTQLKNLTRGMGGRRERTRPEQFLKMEIPMPTIDQQKQALEALHKLEPIKRLQAKTGTELDALIPSILDKAFKGEL
jgi:type I restriction enzyme S subunit